MQALLADVRFAIRQLARRPGFSLLAIVTLALGTGAATAVFGIVDRVLLRPLPFPSPGRLVALCETNPSVEGFCVAAPPTVEDWARSSHTLASAGIGRTWPFTMRAAGGAGEGIGGGLATPGLFRTLGVSAAMGRLLADADLSPSGRHVAVLSHAFWRDRFGADPAILQQSIVLDGESYQIVGVLPASAEVPHLASVRVWLPLPFDPRDEENRRWRGFVTVGRLAPGADVGAASAELRALQAALAHTHPDTHRGWSAEVRPLLDDVVGPVRPMLLVFLGAVGILLVVACANVANLMVARGVKRERELVVRAAVGAGPWALFRLLAVESAALALSGTVAGALVASWAGSALLAAMPGSLPRVHEVGLDARVLVFAGLLTLLSGALSGVAPALRAARVDLASAIRAGQQPASWRSALGVRGGLVVTEVALACVLAVGAGLLTRSFASLLRWEPGFDRTHLLTFWTYANSGTYRRSTDVAALFARIEDAMRGIPGVSSVGLASSGPLFGGEETGEFSLEGGSSEPVSARWYDMSPSFFPTLGIALRRGRLLDASDGAGAPRVALINEAMARRVFAGSDPVGRRLRQRNGDPMEIVGVVADIPPFTPGQPAAPEVYWSYRQSPRWASYVVLRTSGDPTGVARIVERRLAEIDPELRPAQVRTMEDLVDGELARPRFHMLLIGVFAALALTLTVVGVYGVIAASVAGRTRELGVRIALGATPRGVLRLVIGEGLALAAAGLGIGLVAAALVSRFAAGMLFGVRPIDPLTYAAIALLIATAAAAACFVPARRATRVDPMEALRAE